MAIALGTAAAKTGHRVHFDTVVGCAQRLSQAHNSDRLPAELLRLRRYGLIIVDAVGYLPFEQETANQFFQLVSSRYEQCSLILTSNLLFSGWGTVFGDQGVEAAMIDRIVHHAEVFALMGSSYRLKEQSFETLPSVAAEQQQV